jgi:hypothetical protein
MTVYNRITVMRLIHTLDPEGVQARAQHRIIRRIYTSKIRYYTLIAWADCEHWLIQLANREGAWPRRPYECLWSEVGVARMSQGSLCACN